MRPSPFAIRADNDITATACTFFFRTFVHCSADVYHAILCKICVALVAVTHNVDLYGSTMLRGGHPGKFEFSAGDVFFTNFQVANIETFFRIAVLQTYVFGNQKGKYEWKLILGNGN